MSEFELIKNQIKINDAAVWQMVWCDNITTIWNGTSAVLYGSIVEHIVGPIESILDERV